MKATVMCNAAVMSFIDSYPFAFTIELCLYGSIAISAALTPAVHTGYVMSMCTY